MNNYTIQLNVTAIVTATTEQGAIDALNYLPMVHKLADGTDAIYDCEIVSIQTQEAGN